MTSHLPLHWLKKWSSFKIDALGLVTMLGAEQVDVAVGRLVSSRYTEYLGLLGAFVIAGDQFTEATPGYQLYNITDSILTTDLAGWFTRWCRAQNFRRGRSKVVWTISDPPTRARVLRARRDFAIALAISFVLHGGLVALTVAQGDWWGLTNAISVIISILVRAYLTSKNREALDNAAIRSQGPDTNGHTVAKFLVVFADGKAVSMYAPPKAIRACFVDKPEPERSIHPWYLGARGLGWIGFAVHVIAIGMSALLTQIVTVIIIVVPTVLTCYFRVGCDEMLIGSRLSAVRIDPDDDNERRLKAFVELELNTPQEQSLLDWNLFPHRSNDVWWNEYDKEKNDYRMEETSTATSIGSAWPAPVMPGTNVTTTTTPNPVPVPVITPAVPLAILSPM